MQHAIKPALTYEGQSIPFRVGSVLVELLCVRLGQAYRVRVCYPSTGREVSELSISYASEDRAREVARRACHLFATGVSVQDVLDQLAAARPVERTRVSPEDALDEAIQRALGGGHAQRRDPARLEALVTARQALDTPEERAAHESLASRVVVSMALSDVEARYRAACAAAVEPESSEVDPGQPAADPAPRTLAELAAAYRSTHPQIPPRRRRRRAA